MLSIINKDQNCCDLNIWLRIFQPHGIPLGPASVKDLNPPGKIVQILGKHFQVSKCHD